MTLKQNNILNTAQKMKFSMKDLFSKCDQIRSFLWIWSHLLQKSFMENFGFFVWWKSHTSVASLMKTSQKYPWSFMLKSRLRFHYRQNRFLNVPSCRLLCNAVIQPFFDNECNSWYPNVNKKTHVYKPSKINK